MAEMKHTPGRWVASGPHDGMDWHVKAPDGDDDPWFIATVEAFAGPHPGGTAANARLIAAAPDMYEALRELADALDDGLCNSGTPSFDRGRLGRAQDAARAALRRAEGGE